MSQPPQPPTDYNNSKSLVIFGCDVGKVPCFRNSYLYGIGSGIASGLVYFMFTSNTRKACNAAVGIFAVVTMGYWTQCRYTYSQTKFQMLRMQEQLQNHSLMEGTRADPKYNELEGQTVDA